MKRRRRSCGERVLKIDFLVEQVVFTADGFVTLFAIKKHDSQTVELVRLDTYDIRGLCVHPACIISVTMTNLKSDSATRASQGKRKWHLRRKKCLVGGWQI